MPNRTVRVRGLMKERMQQFMAFTELHRTRVILQAAFGSQEDPTFVLTLEHVDPSEIARAETWLKSKGSACEEAGVRVRPFREAGD